MKICMAGQGAFGIKHLEAIQKIPGIEVVTLAGGSADSTAEVAKRFNIPHWSLELGECLARPGVEAAILTTPTQMHAQQGEQCMRAGKHVMIEIPIADSLADSERLVRVQKETGLIAMGGHTRRFNPSHQWIHKKIKAGELKVLQMDPRRVEHGGGPDRRRGQFSTAGGLDAEEGLRFHGQPNRKLRDRRS